MSDVNIHPIFSVAFGFSQLPDCAGLNQRLQRLFLEREARGKAYANPNPYTVRNQALFESRFDLFDWDEPSVVELAAYCRRQLRQFVQAMNGYSEAECDAIRPVFDAWFHVTRSGGYFGLHNHPMASWSGVYCVSAGESDGSDPESGRLSFINPMIGNSMFVDAMNARLRPPFSTVNGVGWSLQPGQLILFPSWVLHEVKPFIGSGERITVAFNTWDERRNGS
jgi:uncharacterized protein (TIGR02466 family)